MKKLILAAIFMFSTASAIAQPEKNIDIFQKQTVSSSLLTELTKGITPVLTTKCETKCNMEFRSCMLAGNNWNFCDNQRSICLFGVDGCYGW